MNRQPAIELRHGQNAPAAIVDAAYLGCEEAGVPVNAHVASGSASDLAAAGAGASDVFVGIGIDDRGAVAIHERRLGRSWLPEIRDPSLVEARLAGGDAARLVLGRPLRLIGRRGED